MHDVCPGERVCRGCECGQVRRVCQGRECGQDRWVCQGCECGQDERVCRGGSVDRTGGCVGCVRARYWLFTVPFGASGVALECAETLMF